MSLAASRPFNSVLLIFLHARDELLNSNDIVYANILIIMQHMLIIQYTTYANYFN